MITAAQKARKYYTGVLAAKRPRLAYVGGWLGHGNLGDEVLFQAYRRIFDRYSLVHYPNVGGRVLSVPSRLLKIAKAAVLAGGTLINREGYLASARESLSVFPNFFVFGTGVANPLFWRGKQGWRDTLPEWKHILNRCEYVGVRGPLSAQLLSDIGLSRVEVIGDPVIMLADGLNHQESGMHNSVGFNIGHAGGNIWGDEHLLEREFTRLAKSARLAGWYVRWFVVWPEDADITKRVAQASGTAVDICEVYKDYSAYMDLVRPMSTFVGMKLHAVALATCAYVPSVMLEYRPKCRDYMQSIGQDSATVRTDEFKAEDVWEIISTWNDNRQDESNMLRRNIKPVLERQKERAQQLIRIITENK